MLPAPRFQTHIVADDVCRVIGQLRLTNCCCCSYPQCIASQPSICQRLPGNQWRCVTFAWMPARSHLLQNRNEIYRFNWVRNPSVIFHWLQNAWPWIALNGISLHSSFYLLSSFYWIRHSLGINTLYGVLCECNEVYYTVDHAETYRTFSWLWSTVSSARE